MVCSTGIFKRTNSTEQNTFLRTLFHGYIIKEFCISYYRIMTHILYSTDNLVIQHYSDLSQVSLKLDLHKVDKLEIYLQ